MAQGFMSDLISRQAAIDALGEKPLAWTEGEYELGLQNQWQSDVDALKALPPAQPEPCEDAVSRKDCLQALSHLMDVEGFRSGWAVSRANVECMLKAMPPVTPKQRTDLLKAEIKRMKRSFTTCINSDYYTGYMSALSAVEGCIAQWEGANNESDRR